MFASAAVTAVLLATVRAGVDVVIAVQRRPELSRAVS
jgi:antitoxin (DNA-binding transcriptional repressor) of toxin-antitoxin stability system